jgi:hypothetical protein
MAQAEQMHQTAGGHPDVETLRRFAHGRLHGPAMRQAERHVAGCDACCRAVQAVPDDRLVGLLRRGAVALLLAVALCAGALPGCGPSGVGSVDFDKAPDARAVAAPPKPKPGQAPPRRVVRPPGKTRSEFSPG